MSDVGHVHAGEHDRHGDSGHPLAGVDHEHDGMVTHSASVHSHVVGTDHGAGALRVAAISSLVLAAVAAVELLGAALSASAGVLADGLHNLGDVSTTVALAAAFLLSRRAPTRRFPYGYHRTEDLAGLVVLALIVASAIASGVTSIEHLLHPPRLTHTNLALAVAGVGFVGNEVVAQYKVSSGRRLRSMALVADGRHSRLDGVASLGAGVGVVGAMLGAPLLDPVAGLVITAIIAAVAWDTGRSLTARLLDEADASLVSTLEDVAASTPGVISVSEARARWMGRRVHAELTLAVAADTRLRDAHELGEQVRHRLYHRIEPLSDVVIHLDPAGEHGAHAAVSHHFT